MSEIQPSPIEHFPPAPPTALDDSWKSWIAENLMLDNDPASMLQAMVERGLDPHESVEQLRLTMQSPILAGAKRLQARLDKRDWVLETLSKAAKTSAAHGKVDRRHRLSTEDFLEGYYALNKPVLITGMMEDWPAMSAWSLDRLARDFGSREVEVQAKRSLDPEFEINSESHRHKMPLARVIEMIQSLGHTNDFYMTANNSGSNKAALRELWAETGPLADYLDPSLEPQPGFLWLGPQGTVTPLHHDLTNNLMAQVFGSKLVRIMPASQLHRAYNHFHCYSQVDAAAVDLASFPLMAGATIMEVELHPGELLFLPVGCLHHVTGLSASCTMTYTNFRFDNDFASFYRSNRGL